MYLSDCVEQKLLKKVISYTLQLQVMWRLHGETLEAEEIVRRWVKERRPSSLGAVCPAQHCTEHFCSSPPSLSRSLWEPLGNPPPVPSRQHRGQRDTLSVPRGD